MCHGLSDLERARTVFREQVVGTTDDELRDNATELLEFLLTLCLDGIGGIGIASTDDGILEVLSEVILGAEEIGICEVQEGKVFREIIL